MQYRDSLFLSLNFESGDVPSRIELLPAGKIEGRDGRKFYNSDPQKIVKKSLARLQTLPIDVNHSTDLSAPSGAPSPAYGWMTNLSVDKSGAIYANVEWNEKGREALSKKEYRFLSPVIQRNAHGDIDCVLRAALTNSPNLQLPALNSEEEESEEGKQRKYNTLEDSMKKELCAALGLADGASDADVLAAVSKLKTEKGGASGGGTVDLNSFVPKAQLDLMVERAVAAEKKVADMNAEREKAAADNLKKELCAVIDGGIKAGKIPPASKEQYLSLCAATEEGIKGLRTLIDGLPSIAGTQAPEAPPPGAGVELNSEEARFAEIAGYSPDEWKKLKESVK